MTRQNLANWTLADYDQAAAAYCAALPLEHFMEGVPQATQRKIAWVSLGLAARKRRMQVFNELLIQYPRNGNGGGLGQVVPDNMVRRSKKKLLTGSSYNVAFEGIHPFWVLEYLSPSNKRKDYEDNFVKYERELKVPYYLLFDPETLDFHLYRHNGTAYEEVVPNESGRLPVRELEIEVGLLEGWVRFWDRGELIPLPDELQKEVETLRDELDAARTLVVQAKRRADRQKRRAEQEKQRAEQEKNRAETAEQRAEQEKQRAEQVKNRAETAEQRAEQEKQRAEQEKQRAEQEKQRAEQQKNRAETAEQRAAQEKQRAETAEQELRHLRELLERSAASGSAPN